MSERISDEQLAIKKVLERLALCGFCGGSGVVDSGGSEPWEEAIDIRCGHCDGSGKEPIPAPMCDLYESCEHLAPPEITAAVGALILRCLDAEMKLSGLPADWFTDSSLETWFPLTSRELKQAHARIAELEKALRLILRDKEFDGCCVLNRDRCRDIARAALAKPALPSGKAKGAGE